MTAIKRLFLCALALPMLLFPGATLWACEAQSTKQGLGTVVGAILGGVVGHQIGSGSGRTAATIGGVILGGVAGNAIGKRMDQEDCRRMAQALNNNAAGQSSSWTNTKSGASYTVTPGEMVDNQNGTQCRSFTQEAIIDGEPKTISGRACRRADGASWET